MGYAAYPALKDSGVPWLGAIPAKWNSKRLKFAVSLINDKVDAEDTELPYMGLEHIESWSGRRIEDSLASSEGIATRFRFGDVLFGKLRPYLAKVHLAAHEGIATTEVLVLRHRAEISAPFLRYYLASSDFIDIVDSSTYGSKMPRANWDFIGNLPLVLPSLEEQQAIARFLDHKTAQIDALIAKKEALLQKLAEKRTALISHAVTKGLDPTVRQKDTNASWLGRIPAHWNIAGLTKYLDSLVDYRGKTPEKTKEGIFLVTAKNIKAGKIDYELSQEFVAEEQYGDIMGRGLPELGDVVFTTEAPLGEAANIDNPRVALAQRVMKFRGRRNVLDNFFLKYWIMGSPFQQHLQSLSTGSTALGIKASKLCLLRVTLPPHDEQIRIVKRLDSVTKQLALQSERIIQAIRSLSEYRSALITAAVTGKIDVRDVPIPEAA